MDVIREFGITVKDLRTRLGISQTALAERADLHRTYLVDIERGRRNLTLQNISKLAGAFGLSISQLFPGETPETREAIQPVGMNSSIDILIIEEDLRENELTLKAFKQARITNRVQVLRDGEAALDFIFCQKQYLQRMKERLPGVVLMDLNLPKVHGLDVLRHIKATDHTRNINVVVLSPSEMDNEVVEAMRLGASGYIVKPVNFHNFSQIASKLNLEWMLLKPDPCPDVLQAPTQTSTRIHERGFNQLNRLQSSVG